MTKTEREQYERDGFHVIDEPRIYASISKLAELTGHDRRTVSDRLRDVVGCDGPSNARLYPTDIALQAISEGKSH